MKKLKIITGAIVRGALLLSPGVAFSIWQWHSTAALINILAAVGLETLLLLAIVFISVIGKAVKETIKDHKEAKEISPEV